MLDDERCILCTRCIRFTRTSPATTRSASSIAAATTRSPPIPGKPFDNNYTLNTVDICPVGALTSKDFRFQMRVWFLKETKSVCTSCATGCNILIGSREEKIYRYTPRDNDAVNGPWMCDAGRLNYKWIGREDRLEGSPSVRGPEVNRPGPRRLQRDRREAEASAAGFGGHRRLGAADQRRALAAEQAQGEARRDQDSVPRVAKPTSCSSARTRTRTRNGARLTGICFTEMGINLPKIADGIRERHDQDADRLRRGRDASTASARICSASWRR